MSQIWVTINQWPKPDYEIAMNAIRAARKLFFGLREISFEVWLYEKKIEITGRTTKKEKLETVVERGAYLAFRQKNGETKKVIVLTLDGINDFQIIQFRDRQARVLKEIKTDRKDEIIIRVAEEMKHMSQDILGTLPEVIENYLDVLDSERYNKIGYEKEALLARFKLLACIRPEKWRSAQC